MHRRPACTLSIPVAASTRGNTRTDLRAFPPLSGPPQFLLPATPQQPHPIIPGRSPAFGPVSQPHGYSTSPHQRESASTRRALPTRHMAAFVGPRLPLAELGKEAGHPRHPRFQVLLTQNRFIIPVLDPSPHRLGRQSTVWAGSRRWFRFEWNLLRSRRRNPRAANSRRFRFFRLRLRRFAHQPIRLCPAACG